MKKKKAKPKQERRFSIEELWSIAYHEIGHVIVIAATDSAGWPTLVTLSPPDSSGVTAFCWSQSLKDTTLTRQNLLAGVACWLGGRAAEILIYGEPKQGSLTDIVTAGSLVQLMVMRLGMAEAFPNMLIDHNGHRYAEKTLERLDAEIENIHHACFERAMTALRRNRKLMDAMALYLVLHRNMRGKALNDFLSEVKRIHAPIRVLRKKQWPRRLD